MLLSISLGFVVFWNPYWFSVEVYDFVFRVVDVCVIVGWESEGCSAWCAWIAVALAAVAAVFLRGCADSVVVYLSLSAAPR